MPARQHSIGNRLQNLYRWYLSYRLIATSAMNLTLMINTHLHLLCKSLLIIRSLQCKLSKPVFWKEGWNLSYMSRASIIMPNGLYAKGLPNAKSIEIITSFLGKYLLSRKLGKIGKFCKIDPWFRSHCSFHFPKFDSRLEDSERGEQSEEGKKCSAECTAYFSSLGLSPQVIDCATWSMTWPWA